MDVVELTCFGRDLEPRPRAFTIIRRFHPCRTRLLLSIERSGSAAEAGGAGLDRGAAAIGVQVDRAATGSAGVGST